MKNVLALVGLMVVGVGGLGWYLGWYQIATAPASAGIRHIEVDVNTNKIANDIKKGKKKVGEILHTDGASATPAPNAPKQVEGQPVVTFSNGGAQIVLPVLNIGGKGN